MCNTTDSIEDISIVNRLEILGSNHKLHITDMSKQMKNKLEERITSQAQK